MAFMAILTAFLVGLTGIGIGANRLNGQETLEQQEQSQPSQLTHASETAPAEEGKPLTFDTVYKCRLACNQVAVLDGIDSAKTICGAYDVKHQFQRQDLTYEKCTKPEAVEEVTAEANKIIDDATTEFEEMRSNQEQQPNSNVPTLTNMIISRAKEHGLDLTTTCGSRPEEALNELLNACGQIFEVARNVLKYVVVEQGPGHWTNRFSCQWLRQDEYDCRYVGSARCSTLPFCEANKDFPGCEQFLDIYGNCEKILADSANKNEL